MWFGKDQISSVQYIVTGRYPVGQVESNPSGGLGEVTETLCLSLGSEQIKELKAQITYLSSPQSPPLNSACAFKSTDQKLTCNKSYKSLASWFQGLCSPCFYS